MNRTVEMTVIAQGYEQNREGRVATAQASGRVLRKSIRRRTRPAARQ